MDYEKIAREAYSIIRGSQRGEDQNLMPHAWDGLPSHYRDVLKFVAQYAAGQAVERERHPVALAN